MSLLFLSFSARRSLALAITLSLAFAHQASASDELQRLDVNPAGEIASVVGPVVKAQSLVSHHRILRPLRVAGHEPRDSPYKAMGAVSYISAQEIERVPPTSLGDIFRSTPGVIASGNRIGASVDLNIRGLQGQNRINVMVDGTRQSNHSYRGYRGSRNEVYVDPDLLAGVDITKGPVAGAGGVGAMGGVVNLRTLDAGDVVRDGETYGVRIKVGLGSNTISSPPSFSSFGSPESTPPSRQTDTQLFNGDAWSGRALAGVVKDNYELVAGMSRRKAGNYFAGTKGKTTYRFHPINPLIPSYLKDISPFGLGQEVYNTSQDMTSLLAKAKIKWGDGHALSLNYAYYHNEYGEMDENFLSYALPAGEWYRAAQHDLSKTRTHTVKSTYVYKPSDSHRSHLWGLTSNVWFSDVESASGIIRGYSGGRAPDGGLIRSGIKTVGADVTNQSLLDTPTGQLTLGNGAEFVREVARENGGRNNSNYMGANPNGKRLLASVFSQAQWQINGWLLLTGGVRYDYFKTDGTHTSLQAFGQRSGRRLNPSLGISIEPFNGVQLFATYARGWRPPSLRETAVVQFGGVSPNPNLRPELSSNIEVGLNLLREDVLRTGDVLRFKAVYFDNQHKDYVIRDRYIERRGNEDMWDLKYKWANIGEAKFRGYEFSAAYDARVFFVEAGLSTYTEVTFCRDIVADLLTFVVPVGCGIDRIGYDYGAMNIPPKYSGSLTVGVRLLEEKLQLGARSYFFGQRYGGNKIIPGAPNIAAYYYADALVDLFASYSFPGDIALNVSVENIGDRYYLDPMSTDIVPSPGRTYRASLSKSF